MSRPLVVWCAAMPWAGIRLVDQHVAAGLSRYAEVLYVDPPVSFLTRLRNPAAAAAAADRPGVDTVAPGIARLTVRVPPLKERPLMKSVALALTRRAIRKATASGGRPVRATVVSSLDRLFGAAREEMSVLYATDDYLAGAHLMGIGSRRLVRLARRQPLRADLIVASSPGIADTLAGLGVSPLMIPNGVDAEHFAATPVPPDDSRVVAFVGHLSERVDVSLLVAVADLGVPLRMIGPRQPTADVAHFDALAGRPNVAWVGTVDYADLPAQLADVVTALVPYDDSDFNRASFPLKILEYLAAGRRVVSTDLPAVRWLDTDLIAVGGTPEAFAARVRESLLTPLREEEIAERRAFAARHTWAERVATFARALGLAL